MTQLIIILFIYSSQAWRYKLIYLFHVLTFSFNLLRVTLTLLLMNVSINKGILFRLVQQLVTIQSYIYSWNIIEWQSFQNFAIVWLNLCAIYLHFFVSHTNNKKAPREYYIFLFFLIR